MEYIYSANAPEPIGPYSQAVKHNGILYVSGQIGIDQATGKFIQESIELETEQVLKNLHAILLEAGLAPEDVIKCSIFIRDMGQFSAINEVYASFFGNHKPARETVEVSKLPANANVEISAIANAS